MFTVPAAMAAEMDWPNVAGRGLRMLRADVIPTDAGYFFCELNHFSGVGATEAYYSAYAMADLLGRSVAGISPIRQQAHLYLTECRRGGFTVSSFWIRPSISRSDSARNGSCSGTCG